MTRVLAVVAAVAMVLGALVLRGDLGGPGVDDVEVVTPDASAGPLPTTPPPGTSVVCDQALRPACPPGSTIVDLAALLDGAAGPDGGHDVLLTTTTTVEVLRAARAVVPADGGAVLARSPIVLAVAASRVEAVDAACGEVPTWTCAAEQVVAGALTPGVAPPPTSTTGLAGFAALTGGHLGTAEYGSSQLEGAAFVGWLDAVEARVRGVADPLAELILYGGARTDVALVTEAAALDAVSRAAQTVPLLRWPTPLAHVAAVAVLLDGGDPDDAAAVGRAATASLLAAGWRPADGTAGDPDQPTIDPAADGLPDGGPLLVLRQRWG